MQCNGARKHLRASVFYLACLFAVCMVIEVINHTNSRVILLSGDDDDELNQPHVLFRRIGVVVNVIFSLDSCSRSHSMNALMEQLRERIQL